VNAFIIILCGGGGDGGLSFCLGEVNTSEFPSVLKLEALLLHMLPRESCLYLVLFLFGPSTTTTDKYSNIERENQFEDGDINDITHCSRETKVN